MNETGWFLVSEAQAPLRSLNQPHFEIDRQWCEVARVSLNELCSGKVKPVSGQDVDEIGEFFLPETQARDRHTGPRQDTMLRRKFLKSIGTTLIACASKELWADSISIKKSIDWSNGMLPFTA